MLILLCLIYGITMITFLVVLKWTYMILTKQYIGETLV
jgi:hypothetical protein